MKAIDTELTKFLGAEAQYYVPIYQRKYSWKKDNCLKLIDDILKVAKDNERPCHFIGSVIYLAKQDAMHASAVKEYLVIDGQQRLTTISIVLLLSDRNDGLIADDDVVEILTIMESYWMRRAICALPTNTAGPVCISMLKSLNATNQLKSFKANLFSLTWAQRMPSDTEIKDTLKTLKIYSLSSSRTKTILDKLENNRRKEYVPTSEYTIEHIMPQTLSDDWKSDLGADANRIHETYVHTIGNLTLTGYNSEYQNKRFSDKVDCTDKAGNAIGYRHTPIKISSYLTTVSKWGEDEILARAEMLSDELITIWKYPKKD